MGERRGERGEADDVPARHLASSLPVVEGEAHGDALLEREVAHEHGAAQRGGAGAREREGLEVHVGVRGRVGGGHGAGARGVGVELVQRELCAGGERGEGEGALCLCLCLRLLAGGLGEGRGLAGAVEHADGLEAGLGKVDVLGPPGGGGRALGAEVLGVGDEGAGDVGGAGGGLEGRLEGLAVGEDDGGAGCAGEGVRGGRGAGRAAGGGEEGAGRLCGRGGRGGGERDCCGAWWRDVDARGRVDGRAELAGAHGQAEGVEGRKQR